MAQKTCGMRAPSERKPERTAYQRAIKRRPSKPKFAAGIAPGPGVAIRGMEVAQTVQSLGNDVRLIAMKTTVVRVYIDPAGFADGTYVTGELTWRRGTAGKFYLPAMNRVRMRPNNDPGLEGQRDDLDLSLNFRLPESAVRTGRIEIALNLLRVPGGDEIPFTPSAPSSHTFEAAPPLRVRAVGLRYDSVKNLPSTITPNSIHFEYLRSYLTRAYPVASVEFSQIVVDGVGLNPPTSTNAFPQNTSLIVNAQLSAMRTSELSNGFDPRIHYYGLVDDEGGDSFMRGSAVYNETTEIFGMVSCGPTGVPNGWVGDTDGSYADWYGAHEIGHTFQRRHPGFPQGRQDADPLEGGFPYPNGQISNGPPRYVGFDIGDPALGLPMRALPGESHHDVMTYASHQWLSRYTYHAILDRLIHEDHALAPLTN